MQRGFDFGAGAELERMRRLLRPGFGGAGSPRRLDPLSQLVRSLIGSRTRDPVSRRSFARLRARFPDWAALATAEAREIEAAIAAVTFPDVKARQLRDAMRRIAVQRSAFDLEFLGRWPVDDALAWLEGLPGVGPKVAAAVLNFSTLSRPAFVVDTHVLRVLRRLGFVPARAEAKHVRTVVMEAADGWSAVALAELHALLKRLGQDACHAQEPPGCRTCPLSPLCRTAVRTG